MNDNRTLCLSRIWLEIFQNSRDPIFFVFKLYPDLLCIATLCLFWNCLAVIAGSSECSKCPTIPLFVRNIVVMVTVSYGWSVYTRFCWNFFWSIKLSISERIHSELGPYVWRRGSRYVRSEAVPVSLRVTRNRSMERHVRGWLWFGINLDTG